MASVDHLVPSKTKNQVCRTCLSDEVETYFSLFEVYSGTVTLNSVITATTGLKIEQGDGLPTAVCQDCKEHASNAYEFRQKSREADIALRNVMENELKNSENLIFESDPDVKTERTLPVDFDVYLESSTQLPDDSVDFSNFEVIKNELDDHNYENKSNLLLSSTKLKGSSLIVKSIKVEKDDEDQSFSPMYDTCRDNADILTENIAEILKSHTETLGPKKRGRPRKIITSTILKKLSENGVIIKPAEKNYECIFCKKIIKGEEDLVLHTILRHKDVKVLSCLLCKKLYLRKVNFDEHSCVESKSNETDAVDEIHTDETNSQKPSKIATELSLPEILEFNSDSDQGISEQVKVFQVCKTCSAVFIHDGDIENHYDAEHPELSQRCNLCSKMFASVKSAAKHRKICKEIERKFPCNTCGLKFPYEISLNKHILKSHEGQSVSVKFIDSKTKLEDKQYQCDKCDKRFYRKDLLAKHTKTHMLPIDKWLQCDICEKKFVRRDNLRSHMRVHRVNSSGCLCLYCGRSFSSSSNLIVHMRRHTGEKPYKCDFCGKGFPRSSDLQWHRRSHTGEKPCVCSICGKAFSRSNKLSRHMRVHTGVKPYKCTYCEKAFSQSNDLTLHVRRHTGDKPYICEICGDRFIQGTALQNHRRAHGHFPPTTSDTQAVAPRVITYTVQQITDN